MYIKGAKEENPPISAMIYSILKYIMNAAMRFIIKDETGKILSLFFIYEKHRRIIDNIKLGKAMSVKKTRNNIFLSDFDKNVDNH